jgi:nicotinic acid mononucleotide adenylyltransferase
LTQGVRTDYSQRAGREEASLRSDERIVEVLAGLDPNGPPRLAFVRPAPAGIPEGPGCLLCLSASFNPLTLAHAWLIQEASRLVPPDEVLLLLATTNVDKGATGFPLKRRLTLLSRYAESRPTLSVAVVSHGRFVDKAEAIRTHYPRGCLLTFILGFDTLIRVFDPKYYADRDASLAVLFDGNEFVVANRDPDPPEAIHEFLTRPGVAPFASSIRVIRLPEEIAAISATDVRGRLARGESVAGLVPPEILPFLSPYNSS